MTKLSQCARCKKDRRNCGFYKQEDDTDCPQYTAMRSDPLLDSKDDMGCVWCLVLLVVVFCACVVANLSGASITSMAVTFFTGLFALAGIIWLFNIVRGWFGKSHNQMKTKKQMNMDQKENEEIPANSADGRSGTSELSTRTLLQVALHKLNLQYEFDANQNFILKYQGENFRIIADDDCMYLYIQDLCWYEAPLDDIDNLSLVYKAVNECNMRDVAKLVYTHDRAENELHLHTLYDILWMSQIPNSELYLQASFEKMLHAHHLFFRQMEELRRDEFGKKNN